MTLLFGDKKTIERVRKDETRSSFKSGLDALLEEHYQLPPHEVARIVAMAVKDFYAESDVLDIYQFADEMSRELKKI